MKMLNRSTLLLAICLTGLAGYVDALGYVYIHGYFVSFMSGNSTRLAVHLASGNFEKSLLLVELVFGFALGALLGVLISARAGARKRFAILASVGLLLFIASFAHDMGFPPVAVFCMTLSMGIVNSIFQQDGKVSVPVTYMTGALVQVGQKIAYAFLGRDKYGWLSPLLLWLGLLIGGLIGTLSYERLGLHGLWLAAGFSFLLSTFNLRHCEHESI